LKVQSDEPLSNFSIDFNLRRYIKEEDFMFTLPCEIAWSKFDKSLFGTFLRQNPALSQGLTQFADAAVGRCRLTL